MFKRESISKIYVMMFFIIVFFVASLMICNQAQAAKKKYDIQIKSKVSMYSEEYGQIKGKIIVPKGVSTKVLYSSSNKNVVIVNSTGRVKSLKPGKAYIKLTLAANRKVSKKVLINVVKSPKKIKFDKKNIELLEGDSYQLITTVLPKNITNKVVYKTSNKKVVTIDGNGKITAIAKGKATVGAYLVGTTKKVYCKVIVKEKEKSITLKDSEINLFVEETYEIKPIVLPKSDKDEFIFESSDTDVAEVDSNGLITAVAEGKAVIEVYLVGTEKKAFCTVTVKEQEKSITLGESELKLFVEDTYELKPIILPKSITNEVTYKSSDSSVVTVNNLGLIEAVAEGEATIEALLIGTDKKTYCKVIVKNKEDEEEEEDESDAAMATAPVTKEELEAKFPKEPTYPSLKLKSADMEVTLKNDLLKLDVEEGTIVKTKGYYKENDGGQACYKIVSYDTWWEQLPLELKMVYYHNDRIGCNQVLYKNPADNYGNHRLNNGMVAQLLPNEDGYVRVEQWGLFPGRKDNNRALIHIFANNHTNSKILFAKGAKYVLYYDTKNQAYQNKNGVVKNVPWWLNINSIGNNGNEYALLLHCRGTSKPAIGDAQNVELCGNGATISVPDNEFAKGSADFGMIETGGYVDGLKIHGFIFDSNGLNQYRYYDESKQEYVSMRTTNHTISYFSSGINGYGKDIVKDGNGQVVIEGLTENDLKNYMKKDGVCFNNVEIYGNTFLDNGTAVNTSDGGGDDILIINPTESKNVNIHNNKMYNWGRWAFAVDLGGNGERFYNYSFKQNICIQDETNVCCLTNEAGEVEKRDRHRGLGWIDFEARKCFTNLDVSENYVDGANGWAFNGNGKISENITVNANNISRPTYPWRSIYPYAVTFYSVYAKDLKVTNNRIGYGGIDWGGLYYNVLIENNDFAGAVTTIKRPLGKVVVRNNVGKGLRGQSYGIVAYADLPWIEDSNSEFYLPPNKRTAEVIFEGNDSGGVFADIILADDDKTYRRNISLKFTGNKFTKFVVNAIGIKEYYMTPDQFRNPDIAWAARGCKVSNPVVCRGVDNPVPGGLYYKEGDLVTETLSKVTRLYGSDYFNKLFTDIKNTNGSIKKDCDMYCTKEGVFPLNGEFLNANRDAYFTASMKLDKGAFIYTEDNLYYVRTEGTAGKTKPTHTSGTVKNGTAQLQWIAPIARYEMRPKVTE